MASWIGKSTPTETCYRGLGRDFREPDHTKKNIGAAARMMHA